ncbi:MAG: hypothetical protein WBO37_06520 [Gammaproteobacteria bacterium]
MIRLQKSLAAWGTPGFEAILGQELAGLGIEQLPLQQGLGGSSYATDRPPQVMIISSSESQGGIRIKAGIFYTGIIAGCSCADDPTPVEEQAEYCVIRVDIDTTTGAATITLAEDE